MTTIAHAPAEETPTVQANGIRPERSPLQFFEHHAHCVWNSALDPVEKSAKLLSIREAIGRYLRKVEAMLKVKEQDKWEKTACKRAVAYLRSLAGDLDGLAAECLRTSSWVPRDRTR